MKIFNFFKKKSGHENTKPDYSQWVGKDFEFLLAGDIDLPIDCDDILTPNSIEWSKFIKNNWPHYQVGFDYYSCSLEMPGIQVAFNDEITFEKAQLIANEIILNLKKIGQDAELLVIPSNQVVKINY